MTKRLRGLLNCFYVALLLLGFFLAGGVLPPRWRYLARASPTQGEGFKAGEILVKFREGALQTDVQSVLAAHGLSVIGEIPKLGIAQVAVPVGRELETIKTLEASPLIEYAELDYIAQGCDVTPDDIYYPLQWNMLDIQAHKAWQATTGISITIAILDTGVDLYHPDLNAKIWSNPGEIPDNGLDDDENGYIDDVHGWDFVDKGDNDPQDDNGHGTHVAGIAAAETNNDVGVAGVSWGAVIMPVKVLNSENKGYHSDIIKGLIYAADNGARIINMSFASEVEDPALKEAIEYAHDTKGCLLVAAAGNWAKKGNPVTYPAAFPGVIAVAATDITDTRWSESEHGPFIDLVAPGLHILSTYWFRGAHDYTWADGTSMAAPHVSGVAALVWSINPEYTNDEVEERIERGADDLGTPGWDQYYGWGKVNAYKAVAGSISGHVRNNAGVPLSGATVAIISGPCSGMAISNAGSYRIWGLDSGTYALQARMEGYGVLPPMQGISVTVGTDVSGLDFYFPPLDNLVQNWDFEMGDLSGWSTGGSIEPVITQEEKHTGAYSALLGGSEELNSMGDSWLSQSITVTVAKQPTLSFMYKIVSSDRWHGDCFRVKIKDQGGHDLATLLSANESTDWTHKQYNLSPYIGQTVQLYFSLYQDGAGGGTVVYLDEVSVGSGPWTVYVPLVCKKYSGP